MKPCIYGVVATASMLFGLSFTALAKDGDRWVCSFAEVDKTSGTPVDSAVIYKYEVKKGLIIEKDQDGFVVQFQILRDDAENLVGINLQADNSGDAVEVLIIRKNALTFTSDWVTTPVVLRNRIGGSCVHDD